MNNDKRNKNNIINENIQDEYNTSNDKENSNFINSYEITEDNIAIQDNYYKKLLQIFLICIISSKILSVLLCKKEDVINYITQVKFKDNNTNKAKSKSEINIIVDNNNENKFLAFLNSKIINIKTSPHDFVTNGNIYWKNKTKINITKINKEITSYINMTPSFNNSEELYKRENPKVSLIIPCYNQANFVKKVYASIEKQSLKDIEIIFVDDLSQDNSSEVIKELIEKDQRVLYVKNIINQGVFHSRNNGVLKAKGEYILCVDIDDYLLNDILIKSYETAKTFNLDILHFYVMAGNLKDNIFWKVLKYKSGIMRNDDVQNVFFYGTTRNIWDKFVKREVFLKSIDFMNEKFRSERYTVFSDDAAVFGLFKMAKSYGFLEEVGYFYNWDVPQSETHNYNKPKYINSIFRSCFTIMEYFFEQTEDNKIEKKAGYLFFVHKVYKICKKNIDHLTEGFDYIIKILDLYLNCKFYSKLQKIKLQDFKSEVNKRIENITNIIKTIR